MSVVECPLLVGVPLEPREVALLGDVSGAHELRSMRARVLELALFERRL
jgi:hypothetical protein